MERGENRELRTLDKDPDVLPLVKGKRFRCLGRGEDQITKRAWTERPDEQKHWNKEWNEFWD